MNHFYDGLWYFACSSLSVCQTIVETHQMFHIYCSLWWYFWFLNACWYISYFSSLTLLFHSLSPLGSYSMRSFKTASPLWTRCTWCSLSDPNIAAITSFHPDCSLPARSPINTECAWSLVYWIFPQNSSLIFYIFLWIFEYSNLTDRSTSLEFGSGDWSGWHWKSCGFFHWETPLFYSTSLNLFWVFYRSWWSHAALWRCFVQKIFPLLKTFMLAFSMKEKHKFYLLFYQRLRSSSDSGWLWHGLLWGSEARKRIYTTLA